jgi:hypothetical protein
VSAGAVFAASLAEAQVAPMQSTPGPVGEVIMTSHGELLPPWKELKACKQSNMSECKIAIANPQTHEVAKIGDRWRPTFRPTGNGKEVKRVAVTPQQSTRLSSKSAESQPR